MSLPRCALAQAMPVPTPSDLLVPADVRSRWGENTPVHIIAGAPGAGKSTLTNKLTGANHRTGDSAAAVTTTQETNESVKRPTLSLDKKRRFVDMKGAFDATCRSMEDAMRSTEGAVQRTLGGATSLFLCIKCFSRLGMPDFFVVAQQAAIARGMPIVICVTQWDDHVITDEDGKRRLATREDGLKWLEDSKPAIYEQLGLQESIHWFVLVSAICDDLDDFNAMCEEVEATYYHQPTPYYNGAEVSKIREKTKIVASPVMDDFVFERIIAGVKLAVKIIKDQPWFQTWWARLLKCVPFLSAVVTLAETVSEHLAQDDQEETGGAPAKDSTADELFAKVVNDTAEWCFVPSRHRNQ